MLSPPMGESQSVISSFDRVVDEGQVTLSAWVKTIGAKAQLDLDLVTGWTQGQHRAAEQRTSVVLP